MELQIIRAREFIRMGPSGHFDLKASKAALAQLASACCKRGIRQALMDLRALHPGPKPVFSPDDLVTLVNTFREVGFTHQDRLAVLYGSDPHHRARLFAFIAKLRGWSVQAFDDFEAAVLWLSATEAPPAEAPISTRAKRVPVHKLKPGAAPARVPKAAVPTIQIKRTGVAPPRVESANPPKFSAGLGKAAAPLLAVTLTLSSFLLVYPFKLSISAARLLLFN